MLAEDFVKERYEKEGWKGYGHPPTESKRSNSDINESLLRRELLCRYIREF
jgi:hypothetical protein